MHANPKYLDQRRTDDSSPQLRLLPSGNTLSQLMLRFLRLVRLAVWRAFQHDAFAVAKASAYSSILTFFPALLVVGSVLATSRNTTVYLREISDVLSRILPAGSATALAYLRGTTYRSVGVLVTASLITLWTASGANGCLRAGDSCGTTHDLRDRSGCLWQPHRSPDSVLYRA
jgi:hypothetical protein